VILHAKWLGRVTFVTVVTWGIHEQKLDVGESSDMSWSSHTQHPTRQSLNPDSCDINGQRSNSSKRSTIVVLLPALPNLLQLRKACSFREKLKIGSPRPPLSTPLRAGLRRSCSRLRRSWWIAVATMGMYYRARSVLSTADSGCARSSIPAGSRVGRGHGDPERPASRARGDMTHALSRAMYS
jgi:hypothetical protein